MAQSKKSRHRYPVEHMMISDEITAGYQLEVDRSTAKLERDYAQAQKRLEAAERRAAKAGAKPPVQAKRSAASGRDKKLIDLWEEVEARRQELMAIERLMSGGYSGQRHQGPWELSPRGGIEPEPVVTTEDLVPAVRQAINDSEGAAHSPDHLLDVQAAAAVEAVTRSGWVEQAGWEYAARNGDVTLSCGFHTFEGALADALPKFGRFTIGRRPIGLWEEVAHDPEES